MRQSLFELIANQTKLLSHTQIDYLVNCFCINEVKQAFRLETESIACCIRKFNILNAVNNALKVKITTGFCVNFIFSKHLF